LLLLLLRSYSACGQLPVHILGGKSCYVRVLVLSPLSCLVRFVALARSLFMVVGSFCFARFAFALLPHE
jgi:hypothetical protein